MPSIADVGESKFPKVLLYAHSGFGKTRMVATSPGKVLLIRSPLDHTDSIVGSGVKEIVIHNWAEMDDTGEYLRHEGQQWDWVWLDSISLFQETGLDDIWEDVITAKPSRKEWGLDKGEYGRNMERLSRWVRHIVGVDTFAFGITALPAALEMPDGEVKLGPWVQGKNMSEKICGYMNLVAYMEIKGRGRNKRRVLHFDEGEEWYAKDQYHVFKSKPLEVLSNPAGNAPGMKEIASAIEKAKAARRSGSASRRPARRTRARS